MNPDGSDRKTIVTNCRFADGIAVNVEAGHIYWTNMGIPNLDDGSIERADLDGKNRTFTSLPFRGCRTGCACRASGSGHTSPASAARGRTPSRREGRARPMTTQAKPCFGYWAAHYINRDGGWSVACDALGRIIRCETETLALSVARYRHRRLQQLYG